MPAAHPTVHLLDLEPDTHRFRADLLRGLSQKQKSIPPMYFYDERGSALFDRICGLAEYYPTRTELRIMRQNAGEIAEALGPGATLIEWGAGNGQKVRILLNALVRPAAYAPIDVSREHLTRAAERLAAEYPDIEMAPVCADFTDDGLELPELPRAQGRRVVYFPGSTIGNFAPAQRRALLRRMGAMAGEGGGVLIGVDLQKCHRIIEEAYNDSDGATAAFNLNVLARANAELGADFDLRAFEHLAYYNRDDHRIEMHLRSTKDQAVTIGERSFRFAAGETICTEHSHKFTVNGLASEAGAEGLRLERVWTDKHDWFAVLLFTR